MLVGVISDTHGTLPREVHEAFVGVDRIVHAGDVGTPAVLAELEAIAPVTAVSGNVDPAELFLPPLANVRLGGVRVLVVHRPADVPRPLPDGVGVVVTGHTHLPVADARAGVLHLNPGSASRSRGADRSVALLTIADGSAHARIVALC